MNFPIIGCFSKKKNTKFSNYFRKIVGKSAIFHNWKIQLFLKIVGFLKTKKRRFSNYFSKKWPIFQLFSGGLGYNWKIGHFSKTKIGRFSNYFHPQKAYFYSYFCQTVFNNKYIRKTWDANITSA